MAEGRRRVLDALARRDAGLGHRRRRPRGGRHDRPGTPALPGRQPRGSGAALLQAVADDDLEAAAQLYTDGFRDRCEDHGPGRVPPRFEDRSFDADLVDTRDVDDDTVDVGVRITEFSGEPPFGGGGYDHEEVFRVQRVDGSWRLADAGWPYYGCPG